MIRIAERFLKERVSEEFIGVGVLHKADEVFLTNSLIEIMPVARIDRAIVGDGKPGLITKKLAFLYKKSVREYVKRRMLYEIH